MGGRVWNVPNSTERGGRRETDRERERERQSESGRSDAAPNSAERVNGQATNSPNSGGGGEGEIVKIKEGRPLCQAKH